MINSNEISVVVQGAIDKENTPKCLKSIRKVFPQAEIILSTWEGANVEGLDYDEVIFNKDPGGVKDPFVPTFTNNLLRQMVSTKSGVKKAGRKYILKIRSDLYIFRNNLERCFKLFPLRNKEFSIFNHRLLGCSFFSKKYISAGNLIQPVPFHISDWFVFGLAQDVRDFYIRQELPDEPEQSCYFEKHPYNGGKANLFGCAHQYAPEQYICYKFFERYFPKIDYKDYMSYTQENIVLSEQIIANNFQIFSPKSLGFYCLKKNTNKDFYRRWSKNQLTLPYNLWCGLYREDVFWNDYIKYCDSQVKMPLKVKLAYYLQKGIMKWKKH